MPANKGKRRGRRRVAASEDRTVLNGMESKLFNLVAKGATSAQWAEWLRAPLEHAVASGDKDLTVSLLKAGANGGGGWKGCGGRTLLDAAAEGGNEETLSTILLEKGASADLNTVSGAKKMTPLHRAIAGGHTASARVLMLAGADVRLVDSRNRSVLHYTVEGGHFDLAGNVMLAGADHNAEDVIGDTPLHLAAAHNDVKFVCALLHRKACVNVSNSKGEDPLHVAIKHGHVTVAEALLKAGADPNARRGDENSPLNLALPRLAMVRTLLKYGADVKSSDSAGYTALHWVADSDEPGVVDALVKAGADLEAGTSRIYLDDKEFEGLTPLHLAASNKFFGIIVALVHGGANINVKDLNGLTPLHVLCTDFADDSSAETADILLRWGADETATNNDGKTPGELIESDTDLTGRLRILLTNAPADRAWRRRGMLVLCRDHANKVVGEDREGEADTKVLCHGQGVPSGAAAAGRGQEGGGMLARVVELEDDAVFRMIIRFL